MNPGFALIVLAALVAVAAAVGVLWQRSTGRVRSRAGARRVVVRPADVETTETFGDRVTLLQFSTEVCTFCPATRRFLSDLAGRHDGVVHVDLTRRPEVARRFNVLQTPTTLLLDHRGTVHSRIGGPPRPRELEAELARLLGDDHDHS